MESNLNEVQKPLALIRVVVKVTRISMGFGFQNTVKVRIFYSTVPYVYLLS
jgi:hypothetical protein